VLSGWAGIAANGLWVAGAAVAVATLSWTSWLAACTGAIWREAWKASGAWRWLDAAAALVCLGLAGSARSSAECVVWIAFALCFALLSLRAARLRLQVACVQPPALDVSASSPLAPRRTGADALARAIVAAEPLVVLASAPWLWFPNRWTPLIAACLALPWLARKRTQGRFTARSPADGALLIIVLALPLSVWTATDPQRSLPKLGGIILGLAAYYALVNAVHSPRRALLACLGLAVAALGASGLALLGADWALTESVMLPRFFGGAGRWMAQAAGLPGGGFHPNEVAGMLALLLPFEASLLALRFSHAFSSSRAGWPGRWIDALLAASVSLMALTLAATGSASAFVGTGIALLVLAALWRGRFGRALALLVTAAAASVAWRWLHAPTALSDLRGWSARWELWSRALLMLQDLPIAGVGLGNFSPVANRWYPLFSISPQRVLELSHAHNAFLQVALDLGIPGLVAYCALLLVFLATWRRSAQRWPQGPLRAVGAGLVCGVLGYHVYGLADCIAVGARAGIFLWIILGLMAALGNLDLHRCSSA